jgi:hypothetical protein
LRRYWTLIDILDQPADSHEVREASSVVAWQPLVQELFASQNLRFIGARTRPIFRKEMKPMIRYIVVSIVSGLLFGVLDGMINANPFAQRLYEVYKPIARMSVNVPAGMVIDLVYGFVMAGVFLLLYESLPGEASYVKGVSFACLIWFFRVVMGVAAQWMTFNVPVGALLYTLVAGLAEMLILGMLYGLTLRPMT